MVRFDARDMIQCGHVHDYEPDDNVRAQEVVYPFGPSKALLLCGACWRQFVGIVLRDCLERFERLET